MLDNCKDDIKILVAGHVGSGKTTFVKTLSSVEIISTEKKSENNNKYEMKSKQSKSSITTAFDFGIAYGEYSNKIRVFGAPGHERFSFMWDILCKGTNGYIFLLDSTNPQLWKHTLEQIKIFMNMNPAPFILVANKQDLPEALPVDVIRKILKVPDEIKMLECNALDRTIVFDNVSKLVDTIICNYEDVYMRV